MSLIAHTRKPGRAPQGKGPPSGKGLPPQAPLPDQASTVEVHTYYFHTDHLGTPQKLSDSTQNLAWDAVYEPFGRTTLHTERVFQPLRFPGQYADMETQLHQNWHRDYDPALGRYLQSDPIGLAGGINTYAYVYGNPVNLIDPLGLKPGDGCGDKDTDCIVPDFYPESCRIHDQCYAAPNKSKQECDRQFFWNMFVESGPSPNVLVPFIYFLGVTFGGDTAYQQAQQKKP